jgi:hypothetical protein
MWRRREQHHAAKAWDTRRLMPSLNIRRLIPIVGLYLCTAEPDHTRSTKSQLNLFLLRDIGMLAGQRHEALTQFIDRAFMVEEHKLTDRVFGEQRPESCVQMKRFNVGDPTLSLSVWYHSSASYRR